MKVLPRVRGFICTTAHPEGCAMNVLDQINYAMQQPAIEGAKRVLVIGSSTGYGLASRIVATFAMHAKTIGVFFEKEADEKRTASAGWYNIAAFERYAKERGYYAKSINGDAFSNEIKQNTAKLIREDFGQVDLIIYSLASPRRLHPKTGVLYQSTLKPVGKPYSSKTVDTFKEEIKEITIEPASDEEIKNTIEVMGGEDWEMWIDYLKEENLLAEGFTTFAYTYIGPKLTYPIYKDGTIGHAKAHLKETSVRLNSKLKNLSGKALVSVNKAVVTQASAAIPVVPLYISILFKIMKSKGLHEGCIEQIYRLMSTYYGQTILVDEQGYLRIDDLEMRDDVQEEVEATWQNVSTQNLSALTDLKGYQHDFYELFGFDHPAINYEAEVNQDIKIDSLA